MGGEEQDEVMKTPSFDGVQERMERKKAEYAEKLRNKEAEI